VSHSGVLAVSGQIILVPQDHHATKDPGDTREPQDPHDISIRVISRDKKLFFLQSNGVDEGKASGVHPNIEQELWQAKPGGVYVLHESKPLVVRGTGVE
jgi:hypothetical protein